VGAKKEGDIVKLQSIAENSERMEASAANFRYRMEKKRGPVLIGRPRLYKESEARLILWL